MKRIVSFLIFVLILALLISCGSTNRCTSIEKKIDKPTLTEVAFVKTEVA